MSYAFPRPASNDAYPADHYQCGDTVRHDEAQEGMALLDYFAAHAPLKQLEDEYQSLNALKHRAKQAYTYAAMMMETQNAILSGDPAYAV